MPGRTLVVSVRASLPDDQIGRLRAGFAVLTVLFGITQSAAVLSTPPPERPFAVGAVVALVVAAWPVTGSARSRGGCGPSSSPPSWCSAQRSPPRWTAPRSRRPT